MIELNEQTRWILGRPCFAVIRICETLRRMGYTINRRAEDEQAAAIHWMLCLYEQHGDNWRDEGDKILASAPPPAVRKEQGK